MTFACQAPNPAPAGAWRTAKRNGPMAFRSASPLNRRGVGTYPRAHRILAYSLVACVSVANLASVRVLEKSGLRRVGTLICLPGADEPSVKCDRSKRYF